VPHDDGERISLAHGGGGRAQQRLLDQVVAPILGAAAIRHDGAVVEGGPGKLALTTDGFVVTPLFFPGGDIGRLAVYGTINDLVVCGAVPRALTLGMVLEEGLPMATLERVLHSVADAAQAAGVAVVTGDTKVVGRGKGDGVYLTTTGVGHVPDGVEVGAWRLREGDQVLVSGDLGRHGVAVMSARGELGFDSPVHSDCAPLMSVARALLAAGVDVHCMRDCTRGGLAAVACELAAAGGVDVWLDETALPVLPAVRAATEILGLDPIHLACEGRLVAFVAPDEAPAAEGALRQLDPAARIIGTVRAGNGEVWLRGPYGVERPLLLPDGAQLPRIC